VSNGSSLKKGGELIEGLKKEEKPRGCVIKEKVTLWA
jgi:hypothetical protein